MRSAFVGSAALAGLLLLEQVPVFQAPQHFRGLNVSPRPVELADNEETRRPLIQLVDNEETRRPLIELVDNEETRRPLIQLVDNEETRRPLIQFAADERRRVSPIESA
jgi:hypothetical protein